MKKYLSVALALGSLFATSAAPPPASYSVIIRGGSIYDGSGGTPYVGDVALKGDKIAYYYEGEPGDRWTITYQQLLDDVCKFANGLRKLGIKYDQIDGVVASDQVFVKDPSGFTWEFQEQK